MPTMTIAQIEKEVRSANYQVLKTEQLRPNRWLVIARNSAGQCVAILAQARSLITESDVQDLAELVRLRRYDLGFLFAPGAHVSQHAQRAMRELGSQRMQICSTLPAATDQAVVGRLAQVAHS